jgi:transposase InsO family protein
MASENSIRIWIRLYKNKGPQSLEKMDFKDAPKKRGPSGIKDFLKDEIARTKIENPQFGLRKVRDFLARFKGLKVSAGTIKKTLDEKEIPLVKVEKKRRRGADQIRHFERANPMQLWQSDITSYVLARHSQRVYLTIFMDDHSRYIVAWNLQLKQTGQFVVDCLLNGVQKFGKPEEVLTDQGRQYFTWRGKGDFQKLLDKEGIKHVVSRSHHPQTLGKCERFWETVSKEFWTRARPQDLKDAQNRFEHFVNHYNHFRPHQGLDGMVPADRFFGVEDEVRKVLEETMEKNAIRLAVDEAPRTPVFIIGQIGDQPLSLHGESGKLVLQTPNGIDEITYENFGHKKTILGDNYERNTNGKEETRTEERSVTSIETSTASEGTLVAFDTGREEQGPPDWHCDHGVLGGENLEGRCSEEIEYPSNSSVAVVSTCSLGDVGGTVDSAESENERSDNEQGRRSEISFEEDQRIGEDDRDAGSSD